MIEAMDPLREADNAAAIGTAGPGLPARRIGTMRITRRTSRNIRPRTALRTVRDMAAGMLFVATAVTGFARDGVGRGGIVPSAATAAPGAIGGVRQPQPGPRPESFLPDAVQPVEIRGPRGMLVAIETAAGWSPLRPAPLRMGLVVGQPYRLRLAGLPGHEGRELYPSLRVLARLATPPGMAWRFPVEVAIDDDDVDLALAGSHVRRIVYSACDPELPDAVPSATFDVLPGCDGLAVATTLGDPVAEIVIGNRVPTGDAVPGAAP